MAIDVSSDFGRRVANRLRDEQIVWLTTTSADGTPQPNPVWFLWNGETILVFSQPNQAKLRNIQRNPPVALNFNSTNQGGDIAVITGSAEFDPRGPTDAERADYQAKYAEGIKSIGLTPESMLQTYSELIRVTPRSCAGSERAGEGRPSGAGSASRCILVRATTECTRRRQERTRRMVSHLRRIAALLLALWALVPAALGVSAQDASPVASPAAGVAPVDVAAMALTPDDLAGNGFADYLIADGRTQTLEDRVAEQAAGGGDPAQIRTLLTGLGWIRGYRSRLAHATPAGNEDFDALISSGIVQFADPDGAEAGWGVISQLDTDAGEGTPTASPRTIGDRSRLIDLGAVSLDDGKTHAGYRLVFQSGPLVGDLIVFSAPDQALSAGDVESLGQRQLKRMEQVLADGGPGLSLKVLRWRGSSFDDPDVDNYLKLDGTIYVGLGDTEQDIAIAAETYREATDWYRYEAALSDSTFQYTSVTRFPTAAPAGNWVRDAFARTDKNRPTDSTLEQVSDVPSLGDESVVLKVTTPVEGGEANGYAVFVRMGDEAFSLAIISLDTLDLADIIAMADAQVTCFEAGNCADAAPLPAWVNG